MSPEDSSGKFSATKLGFVLALFLVLMGLAHGWAEVTARKQAQQDEERDKIRVQLLTQARDSGEPLPILPAVDPAHDVDYYRTLYRILFTIWACIILLVPAFCFYIMSRPATVSNYWVLFWTFSYLAYLVHFYWAVFGLFWPNIMGIFQSPLGVNPDPRKVVDHPVFDLVLTLWWGLDVMLAWFLRSNSRPVQLQRGALQVFAFISFFGATVIAPKAGLIAHLLGLAMLFTAAIFLVLRIIIRRLDTASLTGLVYVHSFVLLNKIWPWYKLPTWLGVMNLGALREVLRSENLHGTDAVPITNSGGMAPAPVFSADLLQQRQFDGYFNDLRKPAMGSASVSAPGTPSGQIIQSNPGARFGRNIPLERAWPKNDLLLHPSPREISRRLLARDVFKPAEILNLLAAAWIQFETHDWFFHGEPVDVNPFSIPLIKGDPWTQHAPAMVIRRTRPDPTRNYQSEAYQAQGDSTGKTYPPTYVNAATHWWDSSQIYGDDTATLRLLRTDPATGQLLPDGKLYLDPQQMLGLDQSTGVELTGFTSNWWLGLTLLHTLFTREHNSICTALRTVYSNPIEWPDERIFQTARLVNSALIAKIHTIEWTPAILPNPALQIAMNANWSGILGGPIKEVWGRISESDAFSGIMGSVTNHHSADYSLTEEFVSVYRMHPLIPDALRLCSVATGQEIKSLPIEQIAGPNTRRHVFQGGVNLGDVFYSFGICHPGALVLRNYPNFLRDFERLDNNGNPIERIDLAAVDILRDRERGVPRYNEFRKLMHLPPVADFQTLNPENAKELAEVYDNNIDNLDLMVGMFAEAPPPGFGFSDTAFRIFILMASRRLKSDRFFTDDFNPDVYSEIGFDWVNRNGMRDVLLRHMPELAPVLRGVPNAFQPWKTLDESRTYDPHEEDLAK